MLSLIVCRKGKKKTDVVVFNTLRVRQMNNCKKVKTGDIIPVHFLSKTSDVERWARRFPTPTSKVSDIVRESGLII